MKKLLILLFGMLLSIVKVPAEVHIPMAWHEAVYNKHLVFLGFDSIAVKPSENPYWAAIPKEEIHDDTAIKRGGYVNDTIITVIDYPLFWDRDTLISNIREYPVVVDSITKYHLFDRAIADWDIDRLTHLLRCSPLSSAEVTTRVQRDIFTNGKLSQCDIYTFKNPCSWMLCDTLPSAEYFTSVRHYNDYSPRSFKQLFNSTGEALRADREELQELMAAQWNLSSRTVSPEMFATLCVWLLYSDEVNSISDYAVTWCLWRLPDNVYNAERWLSSLDKGTRTQIVERLFLATCRTINSNSLHNKSTEGIWDYMAQVYPLFMLFCDRMGLPVHFKDNTLICGSSKYVWDSALDGDND